MPFHQAALELQARFYRRFPNAPKERYDLTTIKSRWIGRLACEVVRARRCKQL